MDCVLNKLSISLERKYKRPLNFWHYKGLSLYNYLVINTVEKIYYPFVATLLKKTLPDRRIFFNRVFITPSTADY